MESNNNHIEKIHQYFRDELNDAERRAFESDLSQNDDFRKTFEGEKKMIDGIRAVTKERKVEKAKLEKAHINFIKKRDAKRRKRNWLKVLLAITAVLLLSTLLAKVFWSNNNQNNQQEDQQNSIPYAGKKTKKFFRKSIPIWEIKPSSFAKLKTSDNIKLSVKKQDEETAIYKLNKEELTIYINEESTLHKAEVFYYETTIQGTDQFFLKINEKKYELKLNTELPLLELNDPELSKLLD